MMTFLVLQNDFFDQKTLYGGSMPHSFIQRTQKRILVLVETSVHFGRCITDGIIRYGLERNWEVRFEPRGTFESVPDWAKFYPADGVISRTSHLSSLRYLAQLGIPVVEMTGWGNKYKANVVIDEHALATMAFHYFRERGFEQFAFYSYGRSWWSMERKKAFIAVVSAQGFPCHHIPESYGNVHAPYPRWKESEEKRLREWLLSLPASTAILVASDQQAQRVLSACQDVKIAVPESLAILGVDDDPWYCRVMLPPLSSINTNGKLAGYKAAELLDDLMDGKPSLEKPTIIPPAGISTRTSTDIIAVDDPDVVQALHFIRERACDGITVNDIVQELLLSQKTLERRFRRFLGRTISREITRVQIEKAKELLLHTNFTISAIGKSTGFASTAYFIRVFHRICGETPANFRKINAFPS